MNPIDTALSFEPKTLSSVRVAANPQHTYNLLLCQKQSHEEKITIQRCIISQRDKGMEAILSGTSKMAVLGHCLAF